MIIPTLDTLSGLMSPEGRLYPCRYCGHRMLAGQLVEQLGINVPADSLGYARDNQDRLLQVLGWVKLQTDEDGSAHGCSSQPNWCVLGRDWPEIKQAQRNAIWDWHVQHPQYPLPEFMLPTLEEILGR